MIKNSSKNFSSGNILNKIPFISGWQYASKAYANDSLNYRRKQQWKITFYTLINPIFAYKWFEFLKSPGFKYVSLYRPSLYVKPFRTYVSTKWNKKRKLKVILDTYRFIKSKGDAFSQVLTDKEGLIIADLMFDNTYEAFLKLGYDERFRKEGELVLTLECNQLGGKIISVAFSLEESKEGQWSCIIGCVQGYNTINQTQGAFKSMQKLLQGLRPNSFIIYSVQELSRNLGCAAIYGVGNSIQVNRKKHAIHLPWVHSISFDYNNFWDEVGGKDVGKGWFELPLIPIRKSIQEDVKSHKRALYQRRYKILDDVSLKISDTVKVLQDIS